LHLDQRRRENFVELCGQKLHSPPAAPYAAAFHRSRTSQQEVKIYRPFVPALAGPGPAYGFQNGNSRDIVVSTRTIPKFTTMWYFNKKLIRTRTKSPDI
jgi:hypothetical protein